MSDSSVGTQLPLRVVARSVWRDGAERLWRAATCDVAAGPLEAQDIAEKLELDPASVSRMLKGKQNPTWELLAFIHLECPAKRLLQAEADIADREVRPKPPPSPAEELAARDLVLAEMGILEVVKQKAARVLRAPLPTEEGSP
jgi:transcriptional regulator with XRE-family HTH domain